MASDASSITAAAEPRPSSPRWNMKSYTTMVGTVEAEPGAAGRQCHDQIVVS